MHWSVHPTRMRIILLALVGLLLLSACDVLTPPSSAADDLPEEVAQVVRAAPDEVVQSFLDAWNAQDHEAMYSFVHERSRERYAYSLFQNRYEDAESSMGFQGLEYTINEVVRQGISAAISYDVVISSSFFGQIDDPGRTMRLLQVDGGWQVAWSPMDILDGLASEVTLLPRNRFPTRADIYDRNGQPLAESDGTIIQLWMIENEINDYDACIDLLAEILLRPRFEIEQMFIPYDAATYFPFAEIDPETYLRYADPLRNLCNIYDDDADRFDRVAQLTGRNYYGHGAATHVTGWVGSIPQEELGFWRQRGYRESDLVGRAGVERKLESILSGSPERFLQMIAPGGIVIRDLGSSAGSRPTPVQLTIDRDLQASVARAINDAYNYASGNWAQPAVSQGAAAVVMDVNTGEILAMASYPTFDPRIYDPNNGYGTSILTYMLERAAGDPRRPSLNKAVADQYTPGSVYKIFTMAAAAQEGVFPLDEELFDCTLQWTGTEFGDSVAVRDDWRVVDEMPAAGPVTMWQALSTSCNPFFWQMGAELYQLGQQSGRGDVQAEYAARFGFGTATGIDGLPDTTEAAGNVASANNPTSAINNAIGQGDVQVTVLQMAAATAAIANGGTLYEPMLVRQIGGFDGTPIQETRNPTPTRDIGLDREVIAAVQRGMCNVPVDTELGTAWRTFAIDPPPYTSCGKTGTAQAGLPGTAIAPHAWYVSYAPAENPQIAITVLVLNSREGSEIAAPITRRILDNYFGAPEFPYPDWWNEEDYNPVEPPRGVIGTESG